MSTSKTRHLVLTLLVSLLALIGTARGAAQEPPGKQTVGEVLDTGVRILASGEVFEYTKLRLDGREEIFYTRQGLTLNGDEIEQYEAAHAPPVADEALVGRAREANNEEALDLTVWLRSQPGARVVREVRRGHQGTLDELAEEIRGIHRSMRPTLALSLEEERAFMDRMTGGRGVLTEEQRHYIRTRHQRLEEEAELMREEIRQRLVAAVAADQEALADRIAELGGEVLGAIRSQNALSVRLPAGQVARLAGDPLVARILEVPPAAPELDVQAASLGLTHGFWPDGVVGGLCDVGVLDTGVQKNHPAFSGVTVMSHMGGNDPVGHGTACAGIIASNDARYRGTAYGLERMLVGSNRSELVMSEADWMVSESFDDPEAINLSAGYGRANDADYSPFDRFWDGLIDDYSVTVATSAGNAGPAPVSLTHPASAYNVLAVANVDDRNTVTRTDDRIHDTSSRGPTLGNRKKPDLAAPGTNTRTACNLWESDADFVDVTGTSAAAAQVTAGAVLLADLRGSDDPAAVKAVLINTADAWTDGGIPEKTQDDGPVAGSEWNPTYGWGYLDLFEAWFNGTDVFTDSLGEAYPDFRLYAGKMYGGEKATLVWNRHVGYDGSNYPLGVETLTDLDLALYDEATGARLDASASAVDNVEQVALTGTGIRTVVLKVDVFGSIDPDVELEPFALATEENFSRASLPAISFSPTALDPISPNQEFLLAVEAVNAGSIASHENELGILLPAGFAVTGGQNPLPVGTIAASDSAQAVWTVRAPCAKGRFHATRRSTGSSYGEHTAASAGLDLDVTVSALASDKPIQGWNVPRTFSFGVRPTAWSAVALRPGAALHDLSIDDGMCMSSPYQISDLPGAATDFTVTNGLLLGGGTHYALVRSPTVAVGPSGPHVLEHEVASDHAVNAAALQWAFEPGEVIEVFQSYLEAGTAYDAVVEVLSGTADVALFVYRGDRQSGNRAGADFAADELGGGAGERLRFVAPATGLYAFVVVNENARFSSLTFQLTTGLIFQDGFESGTTASWS